MGLFQGLIQVGDGREALEALRELGALYKARGDQSRAITWYRRYLQEAGEEAADALAVRAVLAELYASTGYREEAVAIYRQLAAGQGDVAAEAQLARPAPLKQATSRAKRCANTWPISSSSQGHRTQKPRDSALSIYANSR